MAVTELLNGLANTVGGVATIASEGVSATAYNARNVDNANGLGQTSYDFRSRVFPEDLASDYNGHYVVININVPVDSNGGARSSLRSITGPTGIQIDSSILANEYSKVDVLRFGTNTESIRVIGGEEAQNRELYSLKRGTRRIKESIALFMPASPVQFDSRHSFENISMTSLMGQVGALGAGLGAGVGAALGTFFLGPGAGTGIGLGVGAISSIGGQYIGQALQLAGSPISPRTEVLFGNTELRNFELAFLMAPRSEKESVTMKQIIDTLRFHSAPEISRTAGIIPTFIPPAEFDITFYNKGVENTNIPRISTCVMTQIKVDYAPTGSYATFRNGHPVAAVLQMAFTEIEVLHKLRIAQGF